MTRTFSVNLTEHPTAAGPLAALYAATSGGTAAISGRTAKGARKELADIIGGEAADVLRAGGAIRVGPRNPQTWSVIDEANDDRADYKLTRVLMDEIRRQGMTQRKVAEKAGIGQQTLNKLLTASSSPSWWLLKATLAGLGKDLHWLADELAKAE